jgi:PIN domain nuclease of toxin-antitoxin system
VRLLLDTQVFLWMVAGSERLPESVRTQVRATDASVWLSAASVWELAIKQGLGRIDFPAPAAEFASTERERHNIAALPVDEASIAHLAKLPTIHKDPFDRMLVCQAIEHELTVVTADMLVRRYPVKTLWAGA